jgi:hypothetical protein
LTEPLETYFRATLDEAEFTAARAEFATGASYAVALVNPSLYRIAPSRLVTVGSAAVDAYKEDTP